MNMNYTGLPGWAQWIVEIGIVIATVLAIIGFARRIWSINARIVHTLDDLDNLPRFMITTAATLADQDQKIGEIHHEVTYNNGTSVKDAVGRVERGVAGLYGRLDAAEANARELRKEIEQTKPPTGNRRPRSDGPL